MKIRMAMIGGGAGSFIGPVHRMAATLDNMTELVSGAFSSDPDISESTGRALGLDPGRVYGSWKEMISAESALPEEKRPHFISIVTPNHLHYEPALSALNAGFNVICDKPLTLSSAEAEVIRKKVNETGLLFCITHNYSGYPMVKMAREMTEKGELGKIRKVTAEYFQGWLSTREEVKGNKQAEWRADPSRAGIAGAMADIGTHAFQLAEYVSGYKVKEVCADLSSAFPDRRLDDDGNVLLRFENGSKGSILVSQVATGEENNFKLRIYGEKGSLTWEQMSPNSLLFRPLAGPAQIFRTAFNLPAGMVQAPLHSRLPAGHPEGFIEGFANIYRNFATAIEAKLNKKAIDPMLDYPGIDDGVRGMKFLEAVVSSSSNNSKWTNL